MVHIVPRPLPGLPSYHVVTASPDDDESELATAALGLGHALATSRYGREGGFVVLFSAGAGRRRTWPHAHVVAVRSVSHKRVVLGLLLVKGWLARIAAPRLRPVVERRGKGPRSLEERR